MAYKTYMETFIKSFRHKLKGIPPKLNIGNAFVLCQIRLNTNKQIENDLGDMISKSSQTSYICHRSKVS